MSVRSGGAPREYAYLPEFIAQSEADRLLDRLLALRDWEQLRLCVFGREVRAPRLTAWYGDPGARYAYSGVVHEPLPWPDCLATLRARLCARLGVGFNSALANLYRDGRDSMGWHSDDEPELGEQPVIASVSLGARRRFRLRHRVRKDVEPIELELEHGSLLAMWGSTQDHWKHSLPKTAGCREVRVNLTFRRVVVR